MINRIEYNVMSAADYVEKAKQKTKKAQTYHSKARRVISRSRWEFLLLILFVLCRQKLVIILVVVVIVLLLIAGGIAAKFVKKWSDKCEAGISTNVESS